MTAKRWLCLLICAVLLCTAGCSESQNTDEVIYCETTAAPVNIDPLLAENRTELTVVNNAFEPLYRIGADGVALPAQVAEQVYSADGLTLTLTLRTDLQWSDGKPVTARDYVFALQRAVLPATKAACGAQLTGIAGAAAILAGKKEPSALGASAADDHTLVLTLTKPNADMTAVLAGPAGIPCRQDFFDSCAGKYGMDGDHIITNGAFYVSRWSQEEGDRYLRLTRSDEYYNKPTVVPAAVQMVFREETDRLLRFEAGDVDCSELSSTLLSQADAMDLQTIAYPGNCYGLVFRTNGGLTRTKAVREALCRAVDSKELAGYLASAGKVCTTIIPAGGYFGGAAFQSPAQRPTADKDKARSLFRKATASYRKSEMEDIALYYVESDTDKAALDYVCQCWQKQLGLYVIPTPLTADLLSQKIRDGEFTVALCSMRNQANDIYTVLQQFGTDGRFAGLASKNARALLKKAETAGSGSLPLLEKAEAELLNACTVLPLYVNQNYYVHTGSIAGLEIEPFHRTLIFTHAQKSGS